MTALQAPAPKPTHRIPSELSPTGKLVYLYLAERGAASVEDLNDALGVPQLRLYPTLECLERRDMVDRAGDEVALRR